MTYRKRYEPQFDLEAVSYNATYTAKDGAPKRYVENDYGLLISSEGSDGLHYPAIDIDHPVEVVHTSKNRGHLYINKGMPWWKYRLLLRVMVFVGLVEPGYYHASMEQGRTYLRKPSMPKDATKSMEELMTRNEPSLEVSVGFRGFNSWRFWNNYASDTERRVVDL